MAKIGSSLPFELDDRVASIIDPDLTGTVVGFGTFHTRLGQDRDPRRVELAVLVDVGDAIQLGDHAMTCSVIAVHPDNLKLNR